MKIGFDAETVRSMTLPQINAFISAHNEMNGEESGERWATQDDIDALA